VYLCVFCGSDNKQRLFHCTALTDCFYNPDDKDGVSLRNVEFLNLLMRLSARQNFIEMESVYCAVRTESLCTIQVNLGSADGVTTQRVSSRSLSAEEQARSQVSPYEICRGQSGTGTCLYASASYFPCPYNNQFFPVTINPPMLYTYLHLYVCVEVYDRFFYQRVGVFTARYVLPTQCIYVFCVDLRTKVRKITRLNYSHGTKKRYAGC
jgi:hypothetical protein